MGSWHFAKVVLVGILHRKPLGSYSPIAGLAWRNGRL